MFSSRGAAASLAALVAGGSCLYYVLHRRRLLRRQASTPAIRYSPRPDKTAPPKVLFFGPAKEFAKPVEQALETTWKIVTVDRESDFELLKQHAREATVLVGGLGLANKLLCAADPNRLKLLQCHFTGTDWLDTSVIPPGVKVASCAGAMDTAIAEWVVGAMLRHILNLGEEDAAMRTRCAEALAAGKDDGFAPPFFAQPRPPFRVELSGMTVGIVGHGRIGSAIAQRVAAFGCRVIATVGREKPPTPTPANLTWLGGRGALPALLGESDFVVLACPLNDATRDLLNKDTLAMLKPSAYLINIARGQVVDAPALYEALQNKRLGGAAIDVWWKLPEVALGNRSCAPYDLAKYPFHELPNVLMSPHTSGWSSAQLDRRIATVAANLDAIRRGETPANVVATGAPATGG